MSRPHIDDLSLDKHQAVSLLERASLPTDGLSDVDLHECPVAFNNKTFLFGDYAIRLSRHSWPREKMLCEAAAIKYVKTFTTIPVPDVLYVQENVDEHIGARVLIMRRVPGTCLEDEWPAMSEERRARLLNVLANYMVQLQQQRFEARGTLLCADDEWDVSGFGGERLPIIHAPGFQVVPHWVKKRGPFRTFGESINHELSEAVEKHEKYREKLSGLRKYIPRVQRMVAKCVAEISADEGVNGEKNDEAIVLHHGDFNARNILVDEEGNITSLLDWEWAGADGVSLDWCDWLEDVREGGYMDQVWRVVKEHGGIIPADIVGFDARRDLAAAIGHLAPWVVGFWEEKEEEFLREAPVHLEKLLEKYCC